MLQWIKAYYDINFNGEGYDAVGRRKGQDLFYILGGGKIGGVAGNGSKIASKPAPQMKSSVSSSKQSNVGSKVVTAKKPAGGEVGADPELLKALNSEMSEMRLNMDTLEKERDFYFGKLRDIEMLLQANIQDQNDLTGNVLKILYASEEEKVTIDEAGQLSITPLDGGEGLLE
jgi:RP/EB family microtubule-associated protein